MQNKYFANVRPWLFLVCVLVLFWLALPYGDKAEVQAAPPKQDTLNLCSYFPPELEITEKTYPSLACNARVIEGHVVMFISLYASPEEAKDGALSFCETQKCTPLKLGEIGRIKDLSSHTQYAVARGCYLVVANGDSQLRVQKVVQEKVLSIFKYVDEKLKTAPFCPPRVLPGDQPPAVPQPPQQPQQPPAAEKMSIGLICNYDDKSDTIRCSADVSNVASNVDLFTEIVYDWELVGADTKKGVGKVFNRETTDLQPGSHTVNVTARDTKNSRSVSETWTFTTKKPPSKFALSVACQVDKNDFVDCTATPIAPPENADLEYTWTWNGALKGEKGHVLSVAAPPGAYNIYQVIVSAKDLKSGKLAAPVTTSVTVNKPADTLPGLFGQISALLPPGLVNTLEGVLLGSKPSAPDLGQIAAAAGAGAGLLTGLALLNNLLGGGVLSQVLSNALGNLFGTGGAPSSTPPNTPGPAAPPAINKPDTLPERPTPQKPDNVSESPGTKKPGNVSESTVVSKPNIVPQSTGKADNVSEKPATPAAESKDSTAPKAQPDAETKSGQSSTTPPSGTRWTANDVPGLPSEVDNIVVDAMNSTNAKTPTTNTPPSKFREEDPREELMRAIDKLTTNAAHQNETDAQYQARARANIRALKAETKAIIAESKPLEHHLTDQVLHQKEMPPEVKEKYKELSDRLKKANTDLDDWEKDLEASLASGKNKGTGGQP